MIQKHGNFLKQAQNHNVINIDELDFIQTFLHLDIIMFLKYENIFATPIIDSISLQDIYIIPTHGLGINNLKHEQ